MEQKPIDPEDLILLEEDLSKGELTSILFLLYGKEDPQWILEKITRGTKNILHDFALHHTYWKTAIVQTLTITQIFEVVENLGIESSEARENLTRECVINHGLRFLYQLCEACTKKPTLELIKHIKERCSCSSKSKSELLEVHLLHLIASRLIKVSSSLDECDFTFILNFFSDKKFSKVDEVLQKLPKKPNSLDNANNNAFNQIHLTNPASVKGASFLGEYKARKLHVLIINQHTFVKETDPEYTRQLPDHNLNERKGTAQDTKALQTLFESFGYKVVVKNDLRHLEISKEVEKATKAASLVDGLVVCILSHGHEGVVYGHNSIPVQIRRIKEIMSSKLLLGKPKLFLIQACQGESLQRSVRTLVSSRLETDGPSQSTFATGSIMADFLTFWSTIEGFASVRHIDHGSWFIQELVKKIRELHKEQHLMDICTAVINEVSQKRGYRDECMLPKLEATFTKNFRFPEAKDDSNC